MEEVTSKFGNILPPPYSLLSLPTSLTIGLFFIGFLAIASVVSTIILLCFISYRMIVWKKHYDRNVGHNQCIIFIFNLLLADLFQACSFLISFHWLGLDAIVAPVAGCTAQGWLLNFGDLSSGFFVLAIAVHTWVSIVRGVRIRLRWFVVAIAFVWLIACLLSSFGLARHGKNFFVRTGAWCWISEQFDAERLWLHYFWIFLFELSTVVIYASIFLNLWARVKTIRLANNPNFDRIKRAAIYMAVYPVVYVLLTLPLAVGRMASLAGAQPPDNFFIFAGCLMTSAGWVDSLLYALTRRVLVTDGFGSQGTSSTGRNDGARHRSHSFGMSRMMNGTAATEGHARTVTITGGGKNHSPSLPKQDFTRSMRRGRRSSSSSGKNLVGDLQRSESGGPTAGWDVKAETKVEVTVVQADRHSSDESIASPMRGKEPMRTAFPFD